MRRHFTVTGFVVDDGRTLLHWHHKLQAWMPPGGHVEEDEEPLEALRREVREETGLDAEVVSDFQPYPFASPAQLPAPRLIMVEDIGGPEPDHQHIDLIYYLRSLGPHATTVRESDLDERWVSVDELSVGSRLELGGRLLPVAEDVRVLAIEAINAVTAADQARLELV